MNKNTKRFLSALPALLLMIAIFIFSSKTADQSSATSDPITEFVINIYESIAGPYNEDVRNEKFEMFSMLVRKTAHMSEYALLAISLSFHFYIMGYWYKKMMLLSILVSFLYACTDEFHQLFIDGRGGRFVDVLIDTSGAFLGAMLFIVFVSVYKKTSKKHELQSI